MADTKKRAAFAAILVTAGCLVMAWVEGVLRPVYPVKSALKIAVFLGCWRETGGLFTPFGGQRP